MNYMLLTQTTGILRPFAIIMGKIMEGIFWFLDLFMEYPSIGLAIILFTVIMYLLMLPLTIKQQKFSKLNSKMNPELQAVQAKYKVKTDQESIQKMQMETQSILHLLSMEQILLIFWLSMMKMVMMHLILMVQKLHQ